MFPPHDNSPPHLLSRNATGQLSLYALPPRALRTIAFFLNAYDRASWAATATHFQNSVRIQSECITEKYRRLAAIFTIPAIDLSSSMLFFFPLDSELSPIYIFQIFSIKTQTFCHSLLQRSWKMYLTTWIGNPLYACEELTRSSWLRLAPTSLQQHLPWFLHSTLTHKLLWTFCLKPKVSFLGLWFYLFFSLSFSHQEISTSMFPLVLEDILWLGLQTFQTIFLSCPVHKATTQLDVWILCTPWFPILVGRKSISSSLLCHQLSTQFSNFILQL